MKKIIVLTLILAVAVSFVACGGSSSSEAGFDSSENITVVSREAGSGTRGAFVELTELLEKDADGNKVDTTTIEAEIANGTDLVITSVSTNVNGIGYISLGSLGDSVSAVTIGGVEATTENVKSGDYVLARPFNIATNGETSELVDDFISFILSSKGQEIVEAEGYISVEDGAEYSASGLSGKITLGGSTSVSPCMEVIAEDYMALNPDVTIEIQQTGSSAGMTAAIDGTVDIGMASRELKDTELETLNPIVIAMDGIAVVVNNNNTLEDLTMEEIKMIFSGSATTWDSLD